MKNLELLPLTSEQKKRIKEFASMYKRMAHIIVEIISFNNNRLIVRVEQKDMVNDKFLTKKELSQRVRDMFEGELPEDCKLTVSAVDYDRKDIDAVDCNWAKQRMAKLGLKNKQLSTCTGIDKCTISSLLSGEKEFTKWHTKSQDFN